MATRHCAAGGSCCGSTARKRDVGVTTYCWPAGWPWLAGWEHLSPHVSLRPDMVAEIPVECMPEQDDRSGDEDSEVEEELEDGYPEAREFAELWKPVPLGRQTHDDKVKAYTPYCYNSKMSDSLPLDRELRPRDS